MHGYNREIIYKQHKQLQVCKSNFISFAELLITLVVFILPQLHSTATAQNGFNHPNGTSLNTANTNPLGIIQQQIKQFPKEVQENYKNNILGALEKEYKETGIDKLETINNLLGKHIFANIKDPREQIIRAIISLEEGPAKFITKSEFSNRLENNNIEYNRDNSKFSDEFLTAYNNRYKTVYKPLLEKKIAETKENIQQINIDINKSQQNIDKSQQNIDKSQQNIDKSQQNIQQMNIDIEKINLNIEEEKNKFINRLNWIEKEIENGKITNKEFSQFTKGIIRDSKIIKINLQKDFPNVRKKIQETSK